MSQSVHNTHVDVDAVREVVVAHLGVPVDAATLTPDRDLYAAGCRYLQVDDTSIATLCDPAARRFRRHGPGPRPARG